MFKYLILFAILLSSQYLSAQVRIEAIVTDVNKEALPFVNIGIRNKNIGTISSESGNFYINIPEQNLKDTLTFSSVGYRELNIPIEHITKTTKFAFLLR